MKGNIVTLIFWGLFYLLDGGKTLIYIFVSASFHESAHMFFYYVFKARIKSVKVLPFGISAEFSSTSKLSFFKENSYMFMEDYALLNSCDDLSKIAKPFRQFYYQRTPRKPMSEIKTDITRDMNRAEILSRAKSSFKSM